MTFAVDREVSASVNFSPAAALLAAWRATVCQPTAARVVAVARRLRVEPAEARERLTAARLLRPCRDCGATFAGLGRSRCYRCHDARLAARRAAGLHGLGGTPDETPRPTGLDDPEPCLFPPGSEGRVATLGRRVANGWNLWRAGDAAAWDGHPPQEPQAWRPAEFVRACRRQEDRPDA